MSQRTESRPGAPRTGDSANHLTEGSRIRGPVNALLRGLITPTMRPMMSPGRDSRIRWTRSIVGAPESASSQLRGLIISVPGVHQWRTSPSTPFPSSPLVRTISLCSVCRPMSAGAVHGPMNGSVLVFVVIDDDIRPGHGPIGPMASPVPASGRGSKVTFSRRCQVEQEGRTASPEGSRSNVPSLGLHSFTGLWKSGSKMDDPLSGSCWRRRWPRSKPVPEILSAALRWAK
jgi:hypothetical protein